MFTFIQVMYFDIMLKVVKKKVFTNIKFTIKSK